MTYFKTYICINFNTVSILFTHTWIYYNFFPVTQNSAAEADEWHLQHDTQMLLLMAYTPRFGRSSSRGDAHWWTLELDQGTWGSLSTPLTWEWVSCWPFPRWEPFSRMQPWENSVLLTPSGRYMWLNYIWLLFSCSVRSDSLWPMDCSTPGLPVLHHLLELAQIHVHRVSDAIQPSHPLLSPPPPAFNFS